MIAKYSVRIVAAIALVISTSAFVAEAFATPLPANRAAPPGIRPTPGRTLPPVGAPASRAYTVVMDRHYTTNPPQAGECSREIHDRYWTYGPDGKVYPTWHPPVDPVTGCAFGHEHGDDPSQSRLTNLNVPFGYANEKMFEIDLVNVRDEDHVGHKILLENNIIFGYNGVANKRCDLLTKFHQGTHSADALTNNLHEMHYNVSCDNGVHVRWKNLHPFGRPGEASVNCTPGSNDHVFVFGAATPLNSPIGGGGRNLPDSACMTAAGLRTAEDWPIDHDVGLGSSGIFGYGMYLQVADTSRFVNFSGSTPTGIARPVDLCNQPGSAPYNSDDCLTLRSNGSGITWNDPRSLWKGAIRRVHINQLTADEPTGRALWYTDVFGKQASATMDAARGVVIPHLIRGRSSIQSEGPQLSRDYSHPTVRAPN
jgi:hypothetical protein